MTVKTKAPFKRLSRQDMARRVAQDIPDGWYVNLGIGLPTNISNHIPADREIVLHSENGILGVGPVPERDKIDPWLVNAGKENVTLVAGASLFHHADSFAMIRGQHLDLCVLGAFEVADNGDLANWTTELNDRVPAVGGAMDLSVGARNLWIMMAHTTKDGQPKLVRKCRYPLTAIGAVKRIYTDLAVIEVTANGFVLLDKVDGLSVNALQEMTGAPLQLA